jgi:hypothetical protein
MNVFERPDSSGDFLAVLDHCVPKFDVTAIQVIAGDIKSGQAIAWRLSNIDLSPEDIVEAEGRQIEDVTHRYDLTASDTAVAIAFREQVTLELLESAKEHPFPVKRQHAIERIMQSVEMSQKIEVLPGGKKIKVSKLRRQNANAN